MNNNNFPAHPLDEEYMKSIEKKYNKSLCRLFADRIKCNFLLQMKDYVCELLGNDLQKYFNFDFSDGKMITGTYDTIDYEICCYIVGIHCSNLVFLSDEERVAKENDCKYREQLGKDVIDNIKIREYAGVFFRKYPIVEGEHFIYFPLPYDLFAIGIRINEMLRNSDDILSLLFNQISHNGLAALSMLENNFLSSAYPVCRLAIEQYVKMLLLINQPENIINTYFKFNRYEITQSCCEQTYPDEFNNLFKNRVNKNNAGIFALWLG